MSSKMTKKLLYMPLQNTGALNTLLIHWGIMGTWPWQRWQKCLYITIHFTRTMERQWHQSKLTERVECYDMFLKSYVVAMLLFQQLWTNRSTLSNKMHPTTFRTRTIWGPLLGCSMPCAMLPMIYEMIRTWYCLKFHREDLILHPLRQWKWSWDCPTSSHPTIRSWSLAVLHPAN